MVCIKYTCYCIVLRPRDVMYVSKVTLVEETWVMSTEGANGMSINPVDCSMIEESINNLNLYISATRDQINKLDPNAQDVEEQREALTRKLSGLEEQHNELQKTLADCQKGAVSPSRAMDIAPKDTAI